MPAVLFSRARWLRLWATFALLAGILAACGGTSGNESGPTPTAMAMSQLNTPTVTATSQPAAATAQPNSAASPVASPGASPVAAGWTSSISRAQFDQQLKAKFPMSAAASDGGTVVIGDSADISTLNPVLANDESTLNIDSLIFETLVSVSPVDGSIVPGLADSWDVSPDGLTYIFHLNKQAKWQDGVDITADDVKFSFDAALNPNTGNSYTTIINENVKSYRVIDPDTFEITAKGSFVSFLQDGPGSIFIVPKHIWGSVGFQSWSFDPGSTGSDPSRVVGSGPFEFKEWVQNDHVTLQRNPNYYGGAPHLDSVIFRVLPDTNSAVTALETGETDVMEVLPAADTEHIQNTPGLAVDVYYTPLITGYMMNLDADDTALFQDKSVRQALMMALDRDSITQNIYLGYGQAANGSQPPLSPGYSASPTAPTLAYSEQGAIDLLASAGWTDSNNDGVLDRDGVKLQFTLLYASGDDTTDSLVSYLQQAWKAIGVKVNLNGIDGGLFEDDLKKGDFDMALVSFNLGTDFSETQLFACDQYQLGFNFMKYCNPTWDKLDDQQKVEANPAKRAKLLAEQSQIIWDDQPMGVIRFGIYRTGYSTKLHNFYPNGYGFLWSLPYVWMDAS